MNYITSARSMNGIITLTNNFFEIEYGNINTQGNITSSNIYTTDINLNFAYGRTISIFDDLNNKAYYTNFLMLSSIIYTNNNIYNTDAINNNSNIYQQ